MAIKIIKNTLTDPINRTCDECGSEFEFTYDDIQRTTSMGIFGDKMSRRFVVCPVCKHECTFKAIKLEEKWGTGKDAEVIGIADLEECGDGISMSMDKETYERLMEKINE